MANTILGVFDDPIAARRALDELRASSLDVQDISVISPSSEGSAGDGHLSIQLYRRGLASLQVATRQVLFWMPRIPQY